MSAAPKRLIEEMGMAEFDQVLAECCLVGSAIGGGFDQNCSL